jgi:hypothetical protein
MCPQSSGDPSSTTTAIQSRFVWLWIEVNVSGRNRADSKAGTTTPIKPKSYVGIADTTTRALLSRESA